MNIDPAFACFCLNEFGDGGPVARPETLQYFTEKHLRACVRKAHDSGKISDAAMAMARKALGI